jgi:hypothetical protein
MSDVHSLPGSVMTQENGAPQDLDPGRERLAPSRKVKMSARNQPYHAALRLVRRLHLYTGLFMTPWVFVYGISGFLFNHPEAFRDREVRPIGRTETAGTGFEDFPNVPAIAARVVEAINAKSPDRPLRLVEPESASFSRELQATVNEDGAYYRIRIDLGSGVGTATVARAPKVGIKEGLSRSRVQLADSPRDRLDRAVPALAERLGLDPTTASVRTLPDVVFAAESGGSAYRLSYNLRSGVVSARDAGDVEDGLTTRSFLTELHKKREYPARIDAAWFWAVGVDATSALMVFWAVSGLIMWWQLRSMRTWGSLVLAVSAAVAAVLALGMHRVLALM